MESLQLPTRLDSSLEQEMKRGERMRRPLETGWRASAARAVFVQQVYA